MKELSYLKTLERQTYLGPLRHAASAEAAHALSSLIGCPRLCKVTLRLHIILTCNEVLDGPNFSLCLLGADCQEYNMSKKSFFKTDYS